MERKEWGLNVGPNYWSVQDAAGVHICGGTGGGMQFPDQMLADARLICAAPDLLEALRTLVSWHGHRDEHDTLLPPEMQEDEIAQAMRVIAKATGEPA